MNLSLPIDNPFYAIDVSRAHVSPARLRISFYKVGDFPVITERQLLVLLITTQRSEEL